MFDEEERAVQAVREMGEVDRACLLHPPSDSDRQLYEVLTDSVALYLARCRGGEEARSKDGQGLLLRYRAVPCVA